MKTRSIKLSIKGLIFVVLFLSMEVLFVGCHAWLLDQAEKESVRQEETKEIIAKASTLLESLVQAGESMREYTLTGNRAALAKFDQSQKDTLRDIAWLKSQLASDPDQSKLLVKIERNMSRGLATLSDVRKVALSEPLMVAAQYALRVRGKLEKQMTNMVSDLNEFHRRERKKIESVSPAVMKLQRDRMKYLLLTGIVINILIAVILALYFVRSITSRLAVVVDNADRLRQGKMLRAPLAGDDEIAQLDEAFHQMSRSLRGEETLIVASQEQLRAIVDQMPIGLVIIAADQGEELIEYANPMLEKLLVFESGALAGSPVASRFSLLGADNNSVSLSDTNGIEGVVQLVAYKKDRTELAVEFSVSDVSLGNLSRRLATVIDVSAKHEMDKMKQAFVSMISHELRTPLTSVSGFLQLLPMGAYGPLEPPAAEAAGVAETHVDQLITLINDLLELEKLEAGKLEMIKVQVPVEEVIDAAVDSVCDLAEAVQAKLIFEGCQLQITGDPDRLKQAFAKVLTGLLHLCPAGETIRILAEAEAGAGKVIIKVDTTRLVLPDDRLQTIFEPFQQLDLTSTKGSLGLGLPLARAIILRHGGACGATKAAEGGVSLWLQLPLFTAAWGSIAGW